MWVKKIIPCVFLILFPMEVFANPAAAPGMAAAIVFVFTAPIAILVESLLLVWWLRKWVSPEIRFWKNFFLWLWATTTTFAFFYFFLTGGPVAILIVEVLVVLLELKILFNLEPVPERRFSE